MAKKIKDTDYLFLSTRVRALETQMLTRDRMEQMLEAKVPEDAAAVLLDCGYGDIRPLTVTGLNQALSAEQEKIYSELSFFAPDPVLIDVFKVRYDYHNAKVLLKSEAMGVDGAALYSRSGRFAPEKLQELYHEERYSELPESFGKALAEAKSILARTANPQLADFVLDRAMFEEMLAAAKATDCPFLTGYVRLLIDSSNLKSLVRTGRMHKDADFLRQVLLPDGNVDEDRLQAAGDGEGLTALFAHSPLEQAAARGAEALSGGSLTAFERACDNAVNTYLRAAKLVSYGPEAVAAYLAAVEGEITAVRMILTGKLAGIAPETIRERLRDLYA